MFFVCIYFHDVLIQIVDSTQYKNINILLIVGNVFLERVFFIFSRNVSFGSLGVSIFTYSQFTKCCFRVSCPLSYSSIQNYFNIPYKRPKFFIRNQIYLSYVAKASASPKRILAKISIYCVYVYTAVGFEAPAYPDWSLLSHSLN